jgi:hypothetical protein
MITWYEIDELDMFGIICDNELVIFDELFMFEFVPWIVMMNCTSCDDEPYIMI